MATYTGSCTISSANVVIDSKVVNCRTLTVASGGAGFVLKNSYLNGAIVQSGGAGFSVQDSLIDSGVQYPACSNGGCPAGKYACGDSEQRDHGLWCDGLELHDPADRDRQLQPGGVLHLQLSDPGQLLPRDEPVAGPEQQGARLVGA